MPVYQYRCSACSGEFEARQSYTDEGAMVCPKCGKTARRLFVPVPIIFKGSGFYVTDCRGGNSALGEAKAEPKVETKGGTNAAAPVDAKSTVAKTVKDAKVESKAATPV